LTVVGDDGRMLPGAVFISSNITKETLASMLRALKTCVERHVGMPLLPFFFNTVVQQHQTQWFSFSPPSQVNQEWKPKGVMMDLCNASRAACQEVFPTTPIRACQFHLTQAIHRWQLPSGERENIPALTLGSLSYKLTNPPEKTKSTQELILPCSAISIKAQKNGIVEAFCRLQRATTDNELQDKLKEFRRDVTKLVTQRSLADSVLTYFRKVHLSKDWAGLVHHSPPF
jgi:hypothetical protein